MQRLLRHVNEGRSAAGRRILPVTLTLATAVVLAGALAGAPAPAAASPLGGGEVGNGVAPSSPLAYQGLAFQSGAIAVSPGLVASDLGSANFNEASSFSSNGPIYRRRGRYHDEGYYGDRYRPQYYAVIGAGSFDPDKQPGNGLWGNAEMGGLVGDALDLGVRVNWYHRSSDNSQSVSTFTDPNGLVHQQVLEGTSVETNLVPVMAVLRVRFPVTGQFQPYLGGGLGWEWLSVSGTDSSGFDIQNDYDGFGAQVFGGLNVSVAPNTGLYGEAVWNKSTVAAKFFDTALGENIRDEINMDGLAVHGGLRFTF